MESDSSEGENRQTLKRQWSDKMAPATGQRLLQHIRRVAFLNNGGGTATDGALLKAFLEERDEVAFEVIVKRHGPMVLGVCRRILSQISDAEDSFQATFLVLIRKAVSLTSRVTVGNWLHGVAYHTALKARTVAWKRRAREKQLQAFHDRPAPPDDSWCEFRALLDEELGRLSAKYREAVVLCDLEGKSRQAAARVLGVPEGTLSGRLTIAHRKLARRLARQGLSAATLATALAQGVASAHVPSTLHSATLKSAAALSAGQATTCVLSTEVALLMNGVTRAMTFAKWGTNSMILCTILALCGTSGLALWPSLAGPQLVPQPAAAPAKQVQGGINGRRGQTVLNQGAPADNVLAKKALQEAVQVLDNTTGDPLARCRLWCKVAELRQKLRDDAGAVTALKKAWSIVETSEWAIPEGVRDIGKAYGQLGDAKAVLDVVASIPESVKDRSGYPRQTTLQESALAATKAGRFGVAEQIAQAMEPMTDYTKDSQITRSIRAARLVFQAKAGDFAGALKAVEALSASEDKVLALVGPGMLFFGIDDDAFDKGIGLVAEGIASVQLQAGKNEPAKECALRALALLPEVKQNYRGAAVVAVVRILANVGDLADARIALSRIPSVDGTKVKTVELKAKMYIAVAEARAGRDDAALALAEEFKEPRQQAYVLQETALVQARAGRKIAAKANLAKAVELVSGAPMEGSGTTLHNIASVQALVGDFAGAEKTTALNPGGMTWANLVDARLQANDFAGAKEATQLHAKDGWWHQIMCMAIASRQTKAGQAAEIREWASNQDNPLVKAHILVGLAEGLFEGVGSAGAYKK